MHKIDPHFRVEVISQTPNPQQSIYAAMHQDYAESFVHDERDQFPDEAKAGEIVVKNLFAGGRGHFGCTEHPQIIFNCGWFPHSVMQQLRTHRVGVSFDVQSFRYTGQRFVKASESYAQDPTFKAVEELVYLRPVGSYSDRQGKRYEYTETHRYDDLVEAERLIARYTTRIRKGFSEEHARGLIPFDVRQHWVMSCNARSLMHILDLRAAKNAQLEIQQLCQLIQPHFYAWMPAIADWYMKNRWEKARLSP
jgi:thymidylate synthase (FAD)